jgi:hypothetical protein
VCPKARPLATMAAPTLEPSAMPAIPTGGADGADEEVLGIEPHEQDAHDECRPAEGPRGAHDARHELLGADEHEAGPASASARLTTGVVAAPPRRASRPRAAGFSTSCRAPGEPGPPRDAVVRRRRPRDRGRNGSSRQHLLDRGDERPHGERPGPNPSKPAAMIVPAPLRRVPMPRLDRGESPPDSQYTASRYRSSIDPAPSPVERRGPLVPSPDGLAEKALCRPATPAYSIGCR